VKRTSIYLDDEQTSALDKRARAEGISRAALIRRIIDRELEATATNTGRERVQRAIKESFGSLADEDVELHRDSWSARQEYLDRIWRQ
jgi:metal-responsive CopG/Arc/MetJ family transcriptional regulator